MLKQNPLLMSDGYKVGHHKMYTPGTNMVYSNYTCRNTKRMNGVDDIVVFGVKYTFQYIKELWDENFFKQPKDVVCAEAKNYLSSYLMSDYDVSHFEALHDLGYLPIEVKSLNEGAIIKAGVPLFTIKNTKPEFFWVTNFLETLISSLIWKPVHSASLALAYRKVLTKYAKETDEKNLWFVDFQAHDFSFRGMQSPESAISSGMGFASIFKGSDTIPILKSLDHYYNTKDTVFSVNATEHSVMCSGSKEGELETFRRLLNTFPKGILSVVSDTWDLWKVLTEYLPQLKGEILARDGKLVIRPDSGNPVDIICGTYISSQFESIDDYGDTFEVAVNSYCDDMLFNEYDETTEASLRFNGVDYTVVFCADECIEATWDSRIFKVCVKSVNEIDSNKKPIEKGLIELLWDVFGGTVNEQGYKVLDSHIGAIYGDSITLERAEQICERLKQKGFASTNIVLGIGSYSLGFSTRDSQGGAVKSTACEINGELVEIFKDPITDDGTKKSAKGLLKVNEDYTLTDCCTYEEESGGLLKRIFLDGEFYHNPTLTEIRERIINTI